MSQSKQRQELYDRIRQSSKQEVILEEMIRLGFWPRQGEMPNDPADEIRRRSEINSELDVLRTEQKRLRNSEAMLNEIRRQRMADSRRRQKETKERCEQKRVERASQWRQRQEREIIYLGNGVSAGLNNKAGDPARLAAQGLPSLQTADEIAAAIGISVNTLRFITYNRSVSKVSNYIRFAIPKKTGGVRRISAPRPTLKYAQRWLLDNILNRVPCHDAAHGFIPGRSIVSNAALHLGSDVLINLDLQDFFPSISYRRTKGLFRTLGYSEAVATIFALLCTEPHTEEIEIDGQTRFVAVGERILPQGAPSSPAITNLICRRLDKALTKVANDLGFTYSRYADDLSFSSKSRETANVGRVLRRVTWIIKKAGFKINDQKTKILRKSRRQEVTGIVVNQKPGIDRRKLKAFRATLFQIEKDGVDGKKWGNGGDLLNSIWGYASFVTMVDPAKGHPLRERVRRILNKHAWHAPKATDKTPTLPQTVPGSIMAERASAAAAIAEALLTELAKKTEQPTTVAPSIPAKPTEPTTPPKKKPWWKFW